MTVSSSLRWIATPLALVLFLACAEEAPPPPPIPEIPVVDVIQRDQPVYLDMVGETRGSADIPIRARVDGVLLGMHFVEGRRVEEGALLYDIDPEPYQAKVVEAQGYLAESETLLAKAKADLDRVRPLAEINAVSQQDLDGAVAQHQAALGKLQASQAQLAQARIELGYTKIHSPISGRIGISAAKVGEYVGKDPNPVVLNFVSLTDPIRVRFSIDERTYLRLARTLRDLQDQQERQKLPPGLELILADGTLHKHRGRSVAADAAVNPQTGTFTLEADFPNPDDIVIAGQFARVRAVVETLRGAILVPQRAISEIQGLFRVFVVEEDDTIGLRQVQIGPKVDMLQIVTEGLRAGDRIVLEGMRLQAGMTIAPRLTKLDERGAAIEAPEAADPNVGAAAE